MLIDIEKIEDAMKTRTINDMHLRLFNEKLNNITQNDLIEIQSKFTNMSTLVWEAGSWYSSSFSEYHTQLADSIKELYTKIVSILDYDFNARYLTDKFAVCVSFYSYLHTKQKAVL